MTTITIGANSFEIHGTLAGAKAYFAGRLNATAYTNATPTEQKQALITMAQWMDRLENSPRTSWTGTKTGGAGQVLSWPRDDATCNGEAVTSGTTPAGIITGEYEGALALLQDPSIMESLSTGTLVKRAKAGSAEVEFFGATLGSSEDLPVPPILYQLFGCYLEGGGAPIPTVTTSSGETSSFGSSPNFGLTRGYA